MQLRFKSLQGSTFTVEAEPSDTIAAVKGKIESSHGHQVSSQKLIFSGKILTDADTVQSCGVSEKDFLVLMVSKPKAAKPAAAAAAAPVAAATAAAPSAPAAVPATASAPSTATDATMSDASAAPPAAAATSATSAESTTPATGLAAAQPAQAETSGPPGSSQFLTGQALEQAVNNIVEMGFEKSEVQKAMRASFNNPERAVEYLMTGIPAHLSQPQAAPAASAPAASEPAGQGAAGTAATQTPAAPATPAPAPAAVATNPRAGNLFEAAAAQAQGGGAGRGAGGRGAGAESMAALRDLGEDDEEGNTALDLGNPAMIAQLRQLVQQNPAALTPLVQALAQSNPHLANAMAEDPEAVLNLLANSAAGGEEGGEEGVGLPSMQELNPEDRTAVEQIIAMGIDETKAIEVYLMCGRNVEMAVQYYFENPQDFED